MQAYKIMHGLWGMGQMMFTKYIVVVDDDVDVHNTSEVLFRLCANTYPQRDSIFTKGPSDVLDHATSEIAIGSKLGIDAKKRLFWVLCKTLPAPAGGSRFALLKARNQTKNWP
jgi:4-hydroxy-3-polyprenylbenzoate decarboxylase